MTSDTLSMKEILRLTASDGCAKEEAMTSDTPRTFANTADGDAALIAAARSYRKDTQAAVLVPYPIYDALLDRLASVTADLAAANARWQAPDYSRFSDSLRPPFEHVLNCEAQRTQRDSECTCGLKWRIEVSTLMTLLNAWQKRAIEAENELAAANAELITLRAAHRRSVEASDFRERDNEAALAAANARAEHASRAIDLAARAMRGEGVEDQGQAWDMCLRILDAAIAAKEKAK